MKIAILGTGALGCYFATHLHAVSELHLFGHWEDQKSVIRAQGLKYQSLEGSERIVPVRVSELEDFQSYFDLVLILVKSFQTHQAAREAKVLLNKNSDISRVISLQNGLGNIEIINQELGSEVSLAGATNQAASILEPGVVKNTGAGLTRLPLNTPKEILDCFAKAQIEVQVEDKIEEILWSKLAINAAINPLTALLRVPNGDLLDSDLTLSLMKILAKEVQQVAASLKIKLNYTDPGAEAIEVAKNTAINQSSMLRDIVQGRQTEVDAICGSVIELGEKQGVKTPLNRSVYRMVKAAESGMFYTLHDLEKLL